MSAAGGRHRALLLFVPRYRSPEWIDLDFLEGEYADLRTTLEDRGYLVDEDSTCDPEQLTRADVTRRIKNFISGARAREHLLVYLSGHGFHHNGRSWFAASDSDPDSDSDEVLESGNVPLSDGWAKAVENSHADKVLFVVDACRERLVHDRATRRIPVTPPPETEKLSYLMACEPEASAAYTGEVPESQEPSFSLLTRALRDIVRDVHGEMATDRLHELLREEMEDLGRRVEDRLPRGFRQEPRLSGERGRDAFPFLPFGARPEDERLHVLHDHRVWKQVERRASQRLRQDTESVTTAIGTRLRKERWRLADDPWLDWETDQRASRWVGFLIEEFLPEEKFSTAEAAVLALAPMLYHAFKVHRVQDLDLQLRRLDVASEPWDKYAQLLQRTSPDREPRPRSRDHRTVRAWILHQEYYRLDDDSRGPLDGLRELLNYAFQDTWELAEVLDAELLAWVFRAMQHGGSVLGEPPERGSGMQQPMRRRLVGYLLAAAQTMALDICELPRVLVEHTGGHGRMNLVQARRSIAAADWHRSGQTLRLSAVCGHQAVMVALQERADYLDGLLHHASTRLRATGSADDDGTVAGLPHRASGEAVLPEKDPVSGTMKFLPVATRFGLDGTRVRDLLTGEQLYRDRRLAIRELYQNAMDACAVRQAREQWRPPPAGSAPWEGHITIRQGGHGNRTYLECVDNASGMDREELLYAFAQGGARLSHLASFRQEQREWEKDPRISFHPNSRFGIGVLSYFMLADEIEVTTRKFHRDRSPGELLRVTVFGPDDLFHVDDRLDDADFLGEPCGTRVRLYLDRKRAADVSCVQALREVLGVARFRTTVEFESQNEKEVWEPQEYRSRARRDVAGSGQIVADPGGDVFWCERGGALLVDGIAVEARWATTDDAAPGDRVELSSAVVNLRGRIQIPGRGLVLPRLSVDRGEVLDDVTRPIVSRLRRAVDSLARSSLLTDKWLMNVAHDDIAIADAIVSELTGTSADVVGEHGSYQIACTGFFPGDIELRSAWTALSPPRRRNLTWDERGKVCRLPSHLALWRYTAHFPQDVARALGDVSPPDLPTAPLLPALPSHARALGHDLRFGDIESEPSWDAVVLVGNMENCAYELHVSMDEMERRIDALNLRMEAPGPQPNIPLPSLLRLISRDGDASWPWQRPGDRIAAYLVLMVCDSAGLSVPEIVRQLDGIGYDMESSACFSDPGSDADQAARLLLSEGVDGQAPWISFAGSERIRAVAGKLDLPVAEVRRRLAELGVEVVSPTRQLTGRDRRVLDTLNVLLGRSYRTDPPEQPLSRTHVMWTAWRMGSDVQEVALHLAALGYVVPEDGLTDTVSPHLDLLGASIWGSDWINIGWPVPLPVLQSLGKLFGRPMSVVAGQLRDLGLDVPFHSFPESLDEADNLLLSQNVRLSRQPVWLDPSAPVPPAHVVLAAATLGMTVQQTIDRLRTLGMQVDQALGPLPEPDTETQERATAEGWIPYSATGESPAVPWAHVLSISVERGWEVRETLEHFAERCLPVGPPPPERQDFDSDVDRVLLSEQANGRPPFRNPRQTMDTWSVITAAREVGLPVAEVRARLLELGVSVVSMEEAAAFRDSPDRNLIAGQHRIRLATGMSVPSAYVSIVAAQNLLTLRDAAGRLAAAGLAVREAEYSDHHPRQEELLILRENASPYSDWINPYEPVGLEHLLVTAHRLGSTVSETAERLREFGLTVPDVHGMVAEAWALVPKA